MYCLPKEQDKIKENVSDKKKSEFTTYRLQMKEICTEMHVAQLVCR